jgi:polysaccharide pyruvyl transferase CsaB
VKVLLSGYYGFGNAGDEALLEGLLTGLRAAGHKPLVLSGEPRATTALHGVPARHRVRGLLAALLECEALVSGGGGLLQDKTSAASLRYYLGVVRLARLLGKRVVVYAQSLGPLSPAGKREVARALRGVPAAARDRASQELLVAMGVPAVLTADPALLLPPPDAPTGDGKPLLLIPRAGHPELGDGLAAVGRHFLGQDRRVALLALHPAEDDGELARLSAATPGAEVVAAADHRQALSLVGAAGLVISARLHGLILAAAAGTPFLGLVYDPKVAGFLADAGAAGFEPPLDLARLIEAAAQCRPLPESSRVRLRERADAGLSWLDGTLRGVA